jgi:hypothetical protein
MTTQCDDQSDYRYFIGIDSKGKGRFHTIALLIGLAETIHETIVPQPTWNDVVAHLNELGEESIGIYPSDIYTQLKQKRIRETPDAVRQCATKAQKLFTSRIGERLQPILYKLVIECAEDALRESSLHSRTVERDFKGVVRAKYGKRFRGRPGGSKSHKKEQEQSEKQLKQLDAIYGAIRQLNRQEKTVTQKAVGNLIGKSVRYIHYSLKSMGVNWKELCDRIGR